MCLTFTWHPLKDSIPLEKVMSRPFRMNLAPVSSDGARGGAAKRARAAASSSSASSSSSSSSSSTAAEEPPANFEYFMPPGVLQEAEAKLAADEKKYRSIAFQ